MTTETKDEKHAGATKRPEELLMPPDGYRLSTLDASTGNARIMFKLYGQREKDWHLSGEVLNSAGEDTREELYLSRTIKDFSSFLDTLRARSELLDEVVTGLEEIAKEHLEHSGYHEATDAEINSGIAKYYTKLVQTNSATIAQSLLTRIKESA